MAADPRAPQQCWADVETYIDRQTLRILFRAVAVRLPASVSRARPLVQVVGDLVGTLPMLRPEKKFAVRDTHSHRTLPLVAALSVTLLSH